MSCDRKYVFISMSCDRKYVFISMSCDRKYVFISMSCERKYVFISLLQLTDALSLVRCLKPGSQYVTFFATRRDVAPHGTCDNL